jgi:hypothetical protein
MYVPLNAYTFNKMQSEREASMCVPFVSSYLEEPSAFDQAFSISR